MCDAATLEEWFAHCRRTYTQGTATNYEHRWAAFLRFAQKPIEQVTLQDINRFLDLLLRNRKRSTVNTYINVFKSFYTWCTKHSVDTPYIGRDVGKLRQDPPDQRVLSPDELTAVLAVCRPIEADTMRFLCNTGLRRHEFRKVTWDDVTPDGLLRVAGKGRKLRYVPLNATAKTVLSQNRQQDNTILFVRRYGSGSATLNRLCERLARRAGIAKFSPHSCRHLFCTAMVRAGVPLAKISQILGHASIEVTATIYTHLLPIDLIGAADNLRLG